MKSRTTVRARVGTVAALALAAIVVPTGAADAGVALKECGTVITGSGASSLDRQLVQMPR